MLMENPYEKYKRIEDLPVKLKVVLPAEGVVRKGIVQIHHGMAEHKGRYGKILKFFADHGYICAIHDARGHGESMENDNQLGYIGENGADIIVEDAHGVTAYLKNNYPDLPLYLIGHSFGSMAARAYIKKYDYELDGAFIVGSPSKNKQNGLGKLVIELMTIFRKESEVSYWFYRMFNKKYEKLYKERCKDKNTPYKENAFLCYNQNVVDEYNKDRKCGFAYTLNGYYTILEIMSRAYSSNPDKWVLKNKDLNIMFLSGADDVFMVSNKEFKEAVDNMKHVGYKNVTSKLYPNMQHEIFLEDGHMEVFQDILNKIEE